MVPGQLLKFDVKGFVDSSQPGQLRFAVSIYGQMLAWMGDRVKDKFSLVLGRGLLGCGVLNFDLGQCQPLFAGGDVSDIEVKEFLETVDGFVAVGQLSLENSLGRGLRRRGRGLRPDAITPAEREHRN